MFSALVEKDQGHKMGLQIPSNRFTSEKNVNSWKEFKNNFCKF